METFICEVANVPLCVYLDEAETVGVADDNQPHALQVVYLHDLIGILVILLLFLKHMVLLVDVIICKLDNCGL